MRLDGISFEAEVTGIPFSYEGRPAVQTIMREITARKNSERRVAVFSKLGQKLSAAKTAREAAETIVEVADQLLGWDSCNFALYSPAEKLLHHVLSRDVIDGRRAETSPVRNHEPPTPLAMRVIEEGGQLILKEDPARMLREYDVLIDDLRMPLPPGALTGFRLAHTSPGSMWFFGRDWEQETYRIWVRADEAASAR